MRQPDDRLSRAFMRDPKRQEVDVDGYELPSSGIERQFLRASTHNSLTTNSATSALGT